MKTLRRRWVTVLGDDFQQRVTSCKQTLEVRADRPHFKSNKTMSDTLEIIIHVRNYNPRICPVRGLWDL